MQWIDRDGKTPLIVACMDSGLYNVAKVLIEMGANVNAYRPGKFLQPESFFFVLFPTSHIYTV